MLINLSAAIRHYIICLCGSLKYSFPNSIILFPKGMFSFPKPDESLNYKAINPQLLKFYCY